MRQRDLMNRVIPRALMRPTAAFLFAAFVAATARAVPPEAIYFGGPILTMEREAPLAGAVAVTGNRITAVGAKAQVMATKGPTTRIVDLHGKTLMPGFVDAHSHFPIGGVLARTMVGLQSPPVGTLTKIDELIARLRERADNTPKGAWVQGAGYDDTLLAEQRHPTRADLDRASTGHPIYVMHVSGHIAVANSLALQMAGIVRGKAPPTGGKYRSDPTTGEPDGVLEESAMGPVAALLPKVAEADVQAAIVDEAAAYAARGVTTAQNGAATADDIQQLATALDQHRLPIRVDVWPVMPLRIAGLDTGTLLAPPPDQDFIRFAATKGFADGSIQAFTGYLSQPYHTHLQQEPTYRGYPRAAREALAAQVLQLHKAGHQIAIHANGDAAIDDVLFAYANAQNIAPRPDARHIVVHAQMARDDQLDEMKRLGVIPSFFNLHVYYWGDRHRDIFIGPERAARISPLRTAIDKDLTITLHADTPVVPMNPLMNVWSAVTRRTVGGAVLGPEQRIGVAEALRAVTINAAYQGFAEHDKGSIAAGKLADFVVLNENPMTVAPEHIRDIAVSQTIVGGKVVWDRLGPNRQAPGR